MSHRGDEPSTAGRLATGERARLLSRIAQAVGRPVGDFLDPALAEAIDQRSELLRLWDEIGTGDGRQQAIAALHAIAETGTADTAQG